MNKLLDILKEIRPEFDFAQSEDFFSSGLLDSYDMILLITELDKQFSISIDGMDIIPENFNSLKNISNLLTNYGVEL
jgi:acyl carrier protein